MHSYCRPGETCSNTIHGIYTPIISVAAQVELQVFQGGEIEPEGDERYQGAGWPRVQIDKERVRMTTRPSSFSSVASGREVRVCSECQYESESRSICAGERREGER